MNFNLGFSNEPVNLDAWIKAPIHRIAEAEGLRARHWRWPHREGQNNSMELNQLMLCSELETHIGVAEEPTCFIGMGLGLRKLREM